MTYWVIKTRPTVTTGKPLFWSNLQGWVDRASCDLFLPQETSLYDLPMGGMWVLASEWPVEVVKVDGTHDLTLTGEKLWVTVGNAAVYIRKTDDGVAVDIYPASEEDGEAVASCYAFDTELSAEEETTA